ncbi:hypothetical protein LINPERPRIM_LOCUS34303, partial [Linum perenne]
VQIPTSTKSKHSFPGAQQEKVVGGARWRTTWGPVVSERQWLKVRRWMTTWWPVVSERQ